MRVQKAQCINVKSQARRDTFPATLTCAEELRGKHVGAGQRQGGVARLVLARLKQAIECHNVHEFTKNGQMCEHGKTSCSSPMQVSTCRGWTWKLKENHSSSVKWRGLASHLDDAAAERAREPRRACARVVPVQVDALGVVLAAVVRAVVRALRALLTCEARREQQIHCHGQSLTSNLPPLREDSALEHNRRHATVQRTHGADNGRKEMVRWEEK